MARATKEVPISVRGESYTTVYGFVLCDGRSDLPEGHENAVQNWAHEEFATALDPGETYSEVGVLEYTPRGEIIDIRRN